MPRDGQGTNIIRAGPKIISAGVPRIVPALASGERVPPEQYGRLHLASNLLAEERSVLEGTAEVSKSSKAFHGPRAFRRELRSPFLPFRTFEHQNHIKTT